VPPFREQCIYSFIIHVINQLYIVLFVCLFVCLFVYFFVYLFKCTIVAYIKGKMKLNIGNHGSFVHISSLLLPGKMSCDLRVIFEGKYLFGFLPLSKCCGHDCFFPYPVWFIAYRLLLWLGLQWSQV
jgi:hypothetical protein